MVLIGGGSKKDAGSFAQIALAYFDNNTMIYDKLEVGTLKNRMNCINAITRLDDADVFFAGGFSAVFVLHYHAKKAIKVVKEFKIGT